MIVYHRTFHSKVILQNGFKDATGTYMTGIPHTGAWVSDTPLDVNEGADGDVLLCLDIPSELFEEYEWVEEDKSFRESLIPATELNKYSVQICPDDEE